MAVPLVLAEVHPVFEAGPPVFEAGSPVFEADPPVFAAVPFFLPAISLPYPLHLGSQKVVSELEYTRLLVQECLHHSQTLRESVQSLLYHFPHSHFPQQVAPRKKHLKKSKRDYLSYQSASLTS